MEANQIGKNLFFKRNAAMLVVHIFMLLLFGSLAAVIIYLLGQWGMDFMALALAGGALLASIAAIRGIILFFKQPAKVEIFPGSKVVIGERIYNIHDVKIDTYQDKMDGGQIFVMLILGIIPGILFMCPLGLCKLEFTAGSEKHTLYYSRPGNIKKLNDAIRTFGGQYYYS